MYGRPRGQPPALPEARAPSRSAVAALPVATAPWGSVALARPGPDAAHALRLHRGARHPRVVLLVDDALGVVVVLDRVRLRVPFLRGDAGDELPPVRGGQDLREHQGAAEARGRRDHLVHGALA